MATVFPSRQHPHEPFLERWGYLSDVLEMGDGTEQRVGLKVIPIREWAFTVRTENPKTTGYADGIAYGDVDTEWAVPKWPDGVYLTAAVTAGSNRTLNVTTTALREFEEDGYVVVWPSEGACELCTVASVTGTTVVVDTLANNYATGTAVLPARLAKLLGVESIRHNGSSSIDLRYRFRLVPGVDPEVETPTVGEVFNVVPYHRVSVTDERGRLIDAHDNLTYDRVQYPRREWALGSRSGAKLWLPDRQAVTDLLTWFHGVKGRYTTFYLPTYLHDLDVVAGLGSTTLTIRRMGYTDRLFPDPAKRTFACCVPSGTITKVTVLSATDNGAVANTETLTLDIAAPSNTSLVSFLQYGRLASDNLEIGWLNNTVAECAIGFQETPGELAPSEAEASTQNPPLPPTGAADASRTTASVPDGEVNVPTNFTVTARDANGLRVLSSAATVASAVTGANTATPSITNIGGGQWRGQYTPANTGTDAVAITLGGVAISGSPYASIVTTEPVVIPGGLPFGHWHHPESLWDTAAYSSAFRVIQAHSPSRADYALTVLENARDAGLRLFVNFDYTSEWIDQFGRFHYNTWKAVIDGFDSLDLESYIADGTLYKHMVIDEPYWFVRWGGVAVPWSTVWDMCNYSKSKYPTLRTTIRAAPRRVLGKNPPASLNACIAQFDGPNPDGSYVAFRAAEEIAAQRLSMEIDFGLNLINGGNGTSGVRGDIGGRWAMSASELVAIGKHFASSPQCRGLINWKYDARYQSSYFGTSVILNAMDELADYCTGEVRS